MNRIQSLVLLGVFLGMAVIAKAAPPPPTPILPILPILPIKPIQPPAAKLKAPEIDLAAGASALVLLSGGFIWIRSRRKR